MKLISTCWKYMFKFLFNDCHGYKFWCLSVNLGIKSKFDNYACVCMGVCINVWVSIPIILFKKKVNLIKSAPKI